MKIKIKTGEKITLKEFFKRWKQGIEAVTPFQQSKISLIGNVFVVIGVIIGLVVTFNVIWWLFIILVGSLLLTSMGLLGNLQKYFALKKINELEKQMTMEVNKNELQSTGRTTPVSVCNFRGSSGMGDVFEDGSRNHT